jgi:hypothetical protein
MAWDEDQHYRYPTDHIAGIEADIAAMEEFAASLAAEVEKTFEPSATRSVTDLRTGLPSGESFPELARFLQTHAQVKNVTYQNVTQFRDNTHLLAAAAHRVSQKYQDSDAFAQAKVHDVRDALENPGEYAGGSPSNGSGVIL